jgi:polyisoprenoid-binding protein YceI
VRRLRVGILTVVMILGVRGVSWAAETWEIDPAHTSVQFAVRHLMISTVRGGFDKVSGTAIIDTHDLTKSSVEVTIDAASINTRNEKRDAHLRNADFLDVEKYPTITFKSQRVEKVGDSRFTVTGDLTLHGVTKEIVLDVEGTPVPIKDPSGKMRVGGQATTKINRTDFGIDYNTPLGTGGVVIGEEINIIIDIEMIQKEAAVAVDGGSATTADQYAACV